MRVIGDLHGEVGRLLDLSRELDAQTKIVQVGDYSIEKKVFDDMYCDSHVDDVHIRKDVHIIPGNHDYWPTIEDCNYLATMNTHFDCEKDYFWVGGAESTDRHLRTQGVDWWVEEEMSYLKGCACLQFYEELSRWGTLPGLFISHDGPYSAIRELHRKYSSDGLWPPSKTQAILQQCLEIKPPKVWIFGHHHISHRWLDSKTGTQYISLGIGEHIDIDEKTCEINMSFDI